MEEKIIYWGHTRGDDDVENEFNEDDAARAHLSRLAILGGNGKYPASCN